jgi:hypothetical protein
MSHLRNSLRVAAAAAIPVLTASLLKKPLADLLPHDTDFLVGPIRKSVERAIRTLITTPRFLHEVRQSMTAAVTSVCALSVSELLSRANVKAFFFERFLPGLATPETRKAIAQAAGAAASEGARPLVSDELLEEVSGPLAQFLPAAIERLIEWMESREMRDTMAERGRELLPRVLEKLNVMQRLLLSAGQFDRRIDEKMPEIIEETLQALERIMRDPAQQRAMQGRILLAIRDWRDGKSSRRESAQIIAEFVGNYLEGLQEPAARESVYGSLETFLTEGGQTVGGLLRKKAGLGDSEISDSLANIALGWLARPETAVSLSAWAAEKASGFLHENEAQELGRVLGIDEVRKERIDSFLREASTRIAAKSGHYVISPARERLTRWAGLLGLGLGFVIGLLEDALRLVGIS